MKEMMKCQWARLRKNEILNTTTFDDRGPEPRLVIITPELGKSIFETLEKKNEKHETDNGKFPQNNERSLARYT